MKIFDDEMNRVGILVVSYGARAVSMIDAFSRSQDYKPEFFIADKQRNPFNAKIAKEHVIIPDLDINEISKFGKKHKDKIDFGIVGPEGPIVDGVRDLVEKETNIPMICPTKKFSVEGSKVLQRELIEECYPNANPKFKVFNPKDYSNIEDVKKDVWSWLDEFNNEVAVKPDRPAVGKGVGVWGDHFNTREELFDHFLSIFKHDSVIIEEKIDGEEFSLQCFSDGRHLVPTPAVRDNKRAFEDDKGPNCYSKDTEILTTDSWKTFNKLSKNDKVAVFDVNTNSIFFEKPKKIYWMRYRGKVIWFKHRNLDLLVTPNHRMLLQQRKKKHKIQILEAQNVKGEHFVFLTGKWIGRDLKEFTLPEYDYKFNRKLNLVKINFIDWIRFLGIYLSEGYSIDKKDKRVYIAQNEKSKYFSLFQEILHKLPFPYTYESKKKCFRINSIQLVKYLKQFGKSNEKYVPDYVKNATVSTIKEFLKTYCSGDGDIHYGKMRFSTSSKKMIDDLQELIIKIGCSGIITIDKRTKMINPLNKKIYPASPIYSIEIKNRTKTSIRKNYIKYVNYNDYVGCVTVSTGFVLVRRNGRVVISGNTGGMGSYKDTDNILPFMSKKDWDEGIKISEKIFEKLRGKNSNPGLRGIPMYMAYTVARDGIKCFEINSRGGMPETQNLMPILKDDFVDVCFDIIDGKLTKLNFKPKATVVIYKVPPTYAGKEKEFTDDTRVDLTNAMNLSQTYDGNFKLYPCSMELRDDEIFALKSRTVCTVGIGNSIKEARKIAVEGMDAIKGASLWYRTDIASEEHIRKSIEHVKKLRKCG